MKSCLWFFLCGWLVVSFGSTAALAQGTPSPKKQEAAEVKACAGAALTGFRPIADTRAKRFQGKVTELTALCRGGQKAVQYRFIPWVDFTNYWGTGDLSSLPKGYLSTSAPQFRGVTGATARPGVPANRADQVQPVRQQRNLPGLIFRGVMAWRARRLKTWPQLRLPQSDPNYALVGGDGEQICKGQLIRARTLTGICNDIRNPLMGSTGMPFARNVEFETTFPDLEQNQLTKNRHGGRINLLTPDPQVISRKLFTRAQSNPDACNRGFGLPNDSPDANCDYQKAPFFNVLAAYWIQFMTHDWFSHMEEGHNAPEMMEVGCTTQMVNGVATPLTPDDVQKLGCRPADRVDKTYVLQDSAPDQFTSGGRTYWCARPRRSPITTRHGGTLRSFTVSTMMSVKRVKRDPKDPAKMLLEPVSGVGGGYLPVLSAGDPAPTAVGRAGVSGVSGQLVDRVEFLSQPVCARAQFVRR